MFKGERVNLRPMKREDIELAVKYQSDEDVTNNYFMAMSITKEEFERGNQ